ncbi:MAG: NUDIX hydrolase [Thermoleophilia bacterium]|nr:NUDIX hydrolase [Thermoleophilia bacterium]
MNEQAGTGPTAAPDPEIPTVVSSRVVYEGKLISMRVDQIELSEGRLATREVVDHPGAVVMAAVDGQGCVYLVRQYRHAIGQYLLELPAGGLEPGEEPLAAAQRELREEVGLEARLWTPLGAFCSSPGFANERLYAFLARDLTPVERDPDDDEDLSVIRYDLSDLFASLHVVEDAKTLATLCLLRHAVIGDPLETMEG